MKYEKNKISIIVPCYNKGGLILQTVKSVLRSVYSNFELIIINDGSTDLVTLQALREAEKLDCRINVIDRVNNGVASARNLGITMSDGEFVLFLDNDDLIDKMFLQKSIEYLNLNPEVDFVFPEVVFFADTCGIGFENSFNLNRLRFSSYIPVTCLHRKTNLKKVNFNEKLGMLEDLDFLIKLAQSKKNGQNLRGIYLFYRVCSSGRNDINENYFSRRKKINDIFISNNVVFSNKVKLVNLLIEISLFFSFRFKKRNEKKNVFRLLKESTYFREEVKHLNVEFNKE